MANTKQQNINIDKILKTIFAKFCINTFINMFIHLQFKDKIHNKSNKN